MQLQGKKAFHFSESGKQLCISFENNIMHPNEVWKYVVINKTLTPKRFPKIPIF